MKKILSSLLILAAMASGAYAQNGFDPYGGMRTVVLAPSQNLLNSAAGATTNTAVDLRVFTGIAKIDFFAQTNSAGTLTVTLQGSTDSTNWSTFANYALSTATAVNWTNTYYAAGTNNLVFTNTFLLPGTITTPTASTAGFASSYLFQAPFTNSGAITLPGNTPVSIGVKIDDQLRYLRAIWTPGGTSTNVSVGAILTAKWTPSVLLP